MERVVVASSIQTPEVIADPSDSVVWVDAAVVLLFVVVIFDVITSTVESEGWVLVVKSMAMAMVECIVAVSFDATTSTVEPAVWLVESIIVVSSVWLWHNARHDAKTTIT
jgi:hypothetical protein